MIPYLHLEKEQLATPSDLILAHDIGLAHYWQAKKSSDSEQAVEHWQKVIANWAVVLENDEYWQEWCGERGQVYGKTITEEHVASAKEKLREKLIGDLAEAAQKNSSDEKLHLEATFHLEVKAARLLKQEKGFSLSSQPNARLYCGPLLTKQLSMQTQVEEFFRLQPSTHHDSLGVILAPIQKNEDQPSQNTYSASQQLRFCFSQLGLPFIYLGHDNPQRTLDV